MLKEELERIAGRSFTQDQYESINKIYSDSDMDKFTFCRSMKSVFKTMTEENHKTVLVMAITDNSGYYMTPNGCYYHLVDVYLEDISIKTGKMTVSIIPNTYRLGYDYNIRAFDYNVIIKNADQK